MDCIKSLKSVSAVVFAVAVFYVLAPRTVEAGGTSSFSGTLSGSGASITMDIDNDACGTSFICTELSSFNTAAGTSTGAIEPGPFTGQSVTEADPVPGTGCAFDPTHVQGCTIGTVTDACKFHFVGGASATRSSSTGDISTTKNVSGTECLDVSHGLPFNFAGSSTDAITGGSGQFAGATGTVHGTFHGQVLTNDFNGHGFAWFKESFSGTITTP
jgi:hypothetical protein